MVSDSVEAVGYAGNDKNVRILSELADDIRDAVVDYQVRDDPVSFPWPSQSRNWSRWRTSRPYMIRIFS